MIWRPNSGCGLSPLLQTLFILLRNCATSSASSESIAKRSKPPIFDSMDNKGAEATRAVRCWIEDRRVCLELADQRVVSFPVAKYPLLASASQTNLEKLQLRLQGRALRWEELDEDIWVDDAVHGRFPHKPELATGSV